MDFLKGKKIEREWQFSPEQIEFNFFSQKDKTRIIIAGEKDFVKQILLLICFFLVALRLTFTTDNDDV